MCDSDLRIVNAVGDIFHLMSVIDDYKNLSISYEKNPVAN